MKNNALILGVYALLVLVGGLIGFFKAGSLISLVASSTSFALLSWFAYGLYKGCNRAWIASAGLVTALLVFFGLRFVESYKFMPAGLMVILSIIVICLLWKNKCSSCSKNSDEK